MTKRTKPTNDKIVTPARVKKLRRTAPMTMRELSYALGYHPNYIRAVECGALPVSRFFEMKFLRVEREIYAKAASEQRIRSRHILPANVLILAKPRKCAGCKQWVIFKTPAQKFCDAECRHRAHVKARRNARAINKTPRGNHDSRPD